MTNILYKVLPILFSFFIIGFCDVAGIATSYIKQDFDWSETLAGFIPSMVFIWFLILSVPSALAMNKTGRKTMVLLSNVVTFFGMLIPFISYNVFTCMAAFIFLGIGNTMLQVSLNPLLSNVVEGKNLTSSLTLGQVIKAVSSFCGPLIAAFAAIASLALPFFIKSQIGILVAVGCIGFFCASIYAIIFSIALKRFPDKKNELSGLMTMGVCGGAAIPPLMGVLTDSMGAGPDH